MPSASAAASTPARSRLAFGVALALVCAALAFGYAPALRGGFVWDDDAHITAPALRTASGLARIWSDPTATQQYYPLLHTAFWLEQKLWGATPLGYHVLNLSLHALAAWLFGLCLRRLAVAGAWFAALLFALHPVAVESAAWISEQKNTLSLVFYLSAALAWLRFERDRSRLAYAAATLLFVAALLTKTVTATLPAALLVLAWWRRRRIAWRDDVVPLAPWFALAASAGLFTAWVERKLIGAEGAAFELDFAQRGLLAGRVVWFYLGKLAWPADLAFFYPRWKINAGAIVAWLPLVAAVALTVILLRRRDTRTRGPLVAWLLFVGSLFPALGFFNVFPFLYSFVADHFQYLPSLAIFALAGAALARLAPPPRVAVTVVLAVGLGFLTRQQAALYRDNETLLRATLARNPASWVAANNLGKELLGDPARRREAMALFERALVLRPAYFEAQNNLGLALTQEGRLGEAIPHLEAALRLKPASPQVHNNLGIALARSGRAEDALRSFREAAALAPALPNIQENWAKALTLLGRTAEAQEHFAVAAKLRAAAPR